MQEYSMNDWVFGVRSVQVFVAELRGIDPERTIQNIFEKERIFKEVPSKTELWLTVCLKF